MMRGMGALFVLVSATETCRVSRAESRNSQRHRQARHQEKNACPACPAHPLIQPPLHRNGTHTHEPAVHASEGTGCGRVPLLPAATARGGWVLPTGPSIEATVVPKALRSNLQNKTEGHSSNGHGAWAP